MLKWEWGGSQFLTTPSLPPQRPEHAASAYIPPVMGKSLPTKRPASEGSDSPLKEALVSHTGSMDCRKLSYCPHLDFGCPEALQVVFHHRNY